MRHARTHKLQMRGHGPTVHTYTVDKPCENFENLAFIHCWKTRSQSLYYIQAL